MEQCGEHPLPLPSVDTLQGLVLAGEADLA